MAPSILPGDLVSIQRANLDEISLGEIVLFSRDGRLFVHRIVAVVRDQGVTRLITRGDRLRHNDLPLSQSELLGSVVSIERDGQRLEPENAVTGWSRVLQQVLRASHLVTRVYLRFRALTRPRTDPSGPVPKSSTEQSWAL